MKCVGSTAGIKRNTASHQSFQCSKHFLPIYTDKNFLYKCIYHWQVLNSQVSTPNLIRHHMWINHWCSGSSESRQRLEGNECEGCQTAWQSVRGLCTWELATGKQDMSLAGAMKCNSEGHSAFHLITYTDRIYSQMCHGKDTGFGRTSHSFTLLFHAFSSFFGQSIIKSETTRETTRDTSVTPFSTLWYFAAVQTN